MSIKTYRIFVVFHDKLNIEYYDTSLIKNYVFINVRPNNLNVYPDLNVVNLHEFREFYPLGKWYTESEVIYNVFKNHYLTQDFDYVGFLQYDIDSSILTDNLIQNALHNADLLSFEPHKFETDYQCRILMDEKKPNTIMGKGRNCYDEIFSDFNKYYSTNYQPSRFWNNTITLCSSFLLKKTFFIEMMEFTSTVIESGKLDKFDTMHVHRIQGGLLERYYGTWLLLKKISLKEIKLPHNYLETRKQNTLIKKIYKKILSVVKR